MTTFRMLICPMAYIALTMDVPAASAQQTSLLNQDTATVLLNDTEVTGTVPVPVSKMKEPAALTAHWLDLKTFSHAERYRSTSNQGGFHLFEDGQQRSLLEGRVKLDAQARYTIGFRASSDTTSTGRSRITPAARSRTL